MERWKGVSDIQDSNFITGRPQRYYEFSSRPLQKCEYRNKTSQMFWLPTAYQDMFTPHCSLLRVQWHV